MATLYAVTMVARLHLVKLASQLRGLVHEPQIRRMHTCQGMQDAAASDKVPKQAVRFKTATSQACHLINLVVDRPATHRSGRNRCMQHS